VNKSRILIDIPGPGCISTQYRLVGWKWAIGLLLRFSKELVNAVCVGAKAVSPREIPSDDRDSDRECRWGESANHWGQTCRLTG
jgi:hypothetical protein